MTVVAWVMLFPSAIIALTTFSNLLAEKGTIWTYLIHIVSLVLTALSAGVIWGGLFNF